MSTDMCRLCRSTSSEIIWVFDEKIPNLHNMKEVIAVTTGVKVILSVTILVAFI